MTPTEQNTAANHLPLAITQGDPAGIGPEIVLKAFMQEAQTMHGCVVVGHVATLRRAAEVVARASHCPTLAVLDHWSEWADCPPGVVPVVQPPQWTVPPRADWLVPWGRVDAWAGQLAGDCVAHAARAALRGEVSGLVTAPLNKESLHAAGAPYDRYPGHTEWLQALAAEHLGCSPSALPVRMMLSNPALRVVLVSIHVSLRQALLAVTPENVLRTIQITHRGLHAMLARPPRIAVAGLNPHAGEGGLFGDEEQTVIAPVIRQAQAMGLDVSGPFAPDTVFMTARSQPERFDVVVAMYHDQGLIPIKYLGLDEGVNTTLGLPFLRTSPDHGTAFDLAGTGGASAASLLAAVRMARLHAPGVAQRDGFGSACPQHETDLSQ